jgi:hypothetical protein
MAAGFLPRFVAAYSRERPRINFLINGLPSNAVRDGVADGQYDIGLTAYHPGRRGFPYRWSSLALMPLDVARSSQCNPTIDWLTSPSSVPSTYKMKT